jgi:truncated hemoglobin YjbI
MEVHAHTHTERKKWTHYFWEFLMLFLAVFCGFLAEYQLEHKIEKDKEKQYIQSLVEDLSTDTANLHEVINNFNKRIRNIDTLLALFPQLSQGYNQKLYQKLEAIKGFADFVKADRTMQQLKNSGGMRLIRNKKAADAITDYDLTNRDLDIDVTSLSDLFNRVESSRFELFDEEALQTDMKEKTITELETGKKNYLLKSEKPVLGKFNNEIREFQIVCGFVRHSEEKLRTQAIDLIRLLNGEYNLK